VGVVEGVHEFGAEGFERCGCHGDAGAAGVGGWRGWGAMGGGREEAVGGEGFEEVGY